MTLDEIRSDIRKRGLTSHQVMLWAKATGNALIAAEADAQAVAEKIRRGPKRAEVADRPVVFYSYPHAAPR